MSNMNFIKNRYTTMNRKWVQKAGVLLAAAGMMAYSLTGCSTSAYDLYLSAGEKTDAAKTGVYDMEISIDNQFDTSTFTEEQLKAINYMKQINYKGKSTVDENQDAVINDSWVKIGGLGFDFSYYGKGDSQYIKYPVMKKYIDIKQMAGQYPSKGELPSIGQETQDKLGKIWENLASKDTVKSEEEVLIPTDKGDIKAKHLVIDVSGDAVKQAIIESQKVLMADPSISKMLKNQLGKAGVQKEDGMTFMTGDMTIDSFEISSYINADGYLVKDEVVIAMSTENAENPLKKCVFKMATVYSQLDEKVDLVFPEITPDQVFTPEELNQEMPSVFKDLIN